VRFLGYSLLVLLGLAALFLGSRNWLGQTRRPIRVIVPFAPGGETDTFARIIKKAIEDNDLLGEPMVIVNSGGAGGTIGSRRVKNADPDGYTLLLLHDALLTAQYFNKVSYGPEAFEPIAGTMETDLLVVVAEKSPYRSLEELLADARDRPDEIIFGANLGAPTHLVGVQLEQLVEGADFRFTQSGGGAMRYAALKGGHITVTVFSVPEYLRFQSDGMRALAFLGKQRPEVLSQVPIVQGLDASNVQMWWAPLGTPRDRIERIAGALQQAMQTTYVRQQLEKMNSRPTFLSAEQVKQRLRERSMALEKIPRPDPLLLPNFPLLLGVVIGLFLLGALFRWLTGDNAVAEHTPPPTRHLATGLLCAGMMIAYVLVLATRTIPFPLGTSAFVFVTGATIAGWKWNQIPVQVLLSVTVGFGLTFLLTDVFFVDLP
jgi:tripartite-type tricarboxylate transporter receptor subunit TctC